MVARKMPEGFLCRFCQSEREGRCFICGFPGEAWPWPELRVTLDRLRAEDAVLDIASHKKHPE
jgi:hypothetical protein